MSGDTKEEGEVARLRTELLAAVRLTPRDYIDAWADQILMADRRLREAEERLAQALRSKITTKGGVANITPTP